MAPFEIVTTSWNDDRDRLLHIRTTVFVEEQHVPMDIEIDEFDTTAIHFLVLEGDNSIGTARVIVETDSNIARIGRVAVLKPYRKMGIGHQLMLSAETWIKQNSAAKGIELHAQVQSLGFYEKLGYVAHGNIFMEADIKHLMMLKVI